VVCLEPDRPSQLQSLPAQVFATTSDQLDSLVQEVRLCLGQGRPVLIGTRTVEQSDRVSVVLNSHDIAHSLLNASQDADEAAVVAGAGLAGQVTVATNMAGRGTDIRLGTGVRECGGLHVIVLAFNDSYRLDRQLAGRAGRQGDPGTYRRLLSLEELSLVNESPEWFLKGVKRLLTAQKTRQSTKTMSPQGSNTSIDTQADGTLSTDGARLAISVFANRSALLFMKWVQRQSERRHSGERQSALDACKPLSHHVAIGGNTNITP
jgi:preprotein translocase subunit SecA